MESHPSVFFSSPNLSGSISNDHIDNNDDNFDLVIPIYDHAFDELMFPNSCLTGLEATSNVGFYVQPSVGEENIRKNCCDGESSGMTMKTRRDRSRTLISERKRRVGMKDKLYVLRSLVPNITKMDKNSIIGDAIAYVRDLQYKSQKLAEEIAVLESSDEQTNLQVSLETIEVAQAERNNLKGQEMILRVTVHEVGDGRFYVMVECNKGDGVASSLYVAVESLECLSLESSDFNMASERYVLTLKLRARGIEWEIRASTVKLWLIGAFHKEGFSLEAMTIS